MKQIVPIMFAALVGLTFIQPSKLRADPAQSLETALARASGGDWEGALAGLPPGIARDVIEWQRLRSGEGNLGDYEAFVARRADWPGLALLRLKGEAAVARSTTSDRVISWFDGKAPRSAAGVVAQVRALLATGQRSQAQDLARKAWVTMPFPEAEAEALSVLMPDVVDAATPERLDHLLWNKRSAEARALLGKASGQLSGGDKALAEARLALQAEALGVDALIAKLPDQLRKAPGLQYDRFVWRMRKDLYDGAAELLLSVQPQDLGQPEAWADRRALLARWLMRQGRSSEAYRAAAAHGLSQGSDFVDLEFLAGFIALRKENDPARAAEHFARMQAEVSTPISLSRAFYWQGRAAEALGQSDAAQKHYSAAARYQTAYYGLLAAEKLGLDLDPQLLHGAPSGDWRNASFTGSSVFQAAKLLEAAGQPAEARRFYLHLAESLDDQELAQLGDMALAQNQFYLAVLIGKAAAERGVILPRAYFPVPDMVPDGLKVSRALALAISRRESEFNPAARSHANAQGLMQVLPGTAQQMAKSLGVSYSEGQLISDPPFNVKVGSAYLAKMIGDFGPSIAMVAAGYNAGPGRPKRWVTEFGDPRQANMDVIDWVETIPFSETRTYVMRVSEGLVIYRAILRGSVGPVRLTAELKG